LTECNLKNEQCGGKCTGYNGSKVWAERKRINKKIECESCRDTAEHIETFSHDIVNGKLGKPIFDKKNFKTLANQVQCICKNTGVC